MSFLSFSKKLPSLSLLRAVALSRVSKALLLGALLPFFSQCATEEPAPPAPTNPPLYVGKITKVFPSQKYVLIQAVSIPTIPAPEAVLLSQNDNGDRLSNLITTAEKLPSSLFFPADIRSGEPLVGDRVYLYESLSKEGKGVSIIKSDKDTPLPETGPIRVPAFENPQDPADKIDLDAILKAEEEGSL